MSQADLAAKLGKPPSYVHKCEVGERRIDPLEFIAWCRGCKTDPKDWISRVEREFTRER